MVETYLEENVACLHPQGETDWNQDQETSWHYAIAVCPANQKVVNVTSGRHSGQ